MNPSPAPDMHPARSAPPPAPAKGPRWGLIFRLGFGIFAVIVIAIAVIPRVPHRDFSPVEPVRSPGPGYSQPAFQPAAQQAAPPQLPLVPIQVTVRKAAMGEGFVCNFENTGERHLKFVIIHKRPTLNQQDRIEMRLDPGRSSELGWREGHVFYPGDIVGIQHPDFRGRDFVLNPK